MTWLSNEHFMFTSSLHHKSILLWWFEDEHRNSNSIVEMRLCSLCGSMWLSCLVIETFNREININNAQASIAMLCRIMVSTPYLCAHLVLVYLVVQLAKIEIVLNYIFQKSKKNLPSWWPSCNMHCSLTNQQFLQKLVAISPICHPFKRAKYPPPCPSWTILSRLSAVRGRSVCKGVKPSSCAMLLSMPPPPLSHYRLSQFGPNTDQSFGNESDRQKWSKVKKVIWCRYFVLKLFMSKTKWWGIWTIPFLENKSTSQTRTDKLQLGAKHWSTGN